MIKKLKLSRRTAALLNIGAIVLALLLYYLNSGAPYLGREQANYYALRSSLAADMETLAEIPVPAGSGNWSDHAEEIVHLMGYGDTVGAMLTKLDEGGGSFFFGMSNVVRKYQNRDGMAVIPLYGIGANESEYGNFTGLDVAVVPTNPEIVRVEVVVVNPFDLGIPPQVFTTEQRYDGVFIATCPGTTETHSLTVYDDLYAHNQLGAIGYDAEGNVIAKTQSEGEIAYENR